MKKIVSGTLGVIVAMAVFFLTAPPSATLVTAAPTVDSIQPAPALASSAAAISKAPCHSDAIEAGAARQFSIGRLASQVQLELSAGLDDPASVLAKAGQGQSAAAIAMLYLAANCSRFRGRFDFLGLVPDDVDLPPRQTCRKLPPQLRNSPLTSLDPALSNSAEAQLLYAANGLVVRQARLADGVEGQSGQDNDELATIERNALRAAHAGLGEAYLFLASHYDDGSFGVANANQALYFAQQFHADRPDSGEAQRLAYFKQRLQDAGQPSTACGNGLPALRDFRR
ncbi:hypothetical protein RugamoR64_63120 [Duganella rhizosphaerae]|uniref:hypothetical protein n=1 Tax=Duganella rhizosphaerae TaxID=2885763 RepID=UPI0030E7970F